MRTQIWFLLAGCAALGLGLTASAQQATVARPPLTNVPAARQPGQSTQLLIDWASAGRAAQEGGNQRARRGAAKFLASNRAAIDRIEIPVLIPSDADLQGRLRLFPNGPFYTASSSATGMAFTLTGSGRAYALPPLTARQMRGGLRARIPADGIVIEQTETGRDASFSRFGATYSISLECANAADARCANDSYLRGLIGRLALALPARGG